MMVFWETALVLISASRYPLFKAPKCPTVGFSITPLSSWCSLAPSCPWCSEPNTDTHYWKWVHIQNDSDWDFSVAFWIKLNLLSRTSSSPESYHWISTPSLPNKPPTSPGQGTTVTVPRGLDAFICDTACIFLMPGFNFHLHLHTWVLPILPTILPVVLRPQYASESLG